MAQSRRNPLLRQRIIPLVQEAAAPLSARERTNIDNLFYQGEKIPDTIIAKIRRFNDTSLQDLQGDYGVAILANIFRRSGYKLKFHGLEYVYPEIAEIIRHTPNYIETERRIFSLGLEHLASREAIEKLRSSPDLLIEEPGHLSIDREQFFIDGKHSTSGVNSIAINHLDWFLRYWAERSYIIGVFGDRAKLYRVAKGMRLRIDIKSLPEEKINFRTCTDITEAFIHVRRVELNRHDNIDFVSFLKYLIAREEKNLEEARNRKFHHFQNQPEHQYL